MAPTLAATRMIPLVGLGLAPLAVLLLIVRPVAAPGAVLAVLVLAAGTLRPAWRGARGTALRPAVVWMGLALGFAAVGQLVALGEAPDLGRPWTGHASYLSSLAALAGLVAVLNARRPGNGAWTLLTAMLMVVFLIPWLENSGLSRPVDPARRLRLDAPWTLFYGLLVLAGTTNFLPTRFGAGALGLLGAFVAEYLGLTHLAGHPRLRSLAWEITALLMAASVLIVARQAQGGREPPRDDVDRLWLWFRDRWGVVWALRVRDRFNREGVVRGWPIRLGWYGVEPAAAGPPGTESVAIPGEASGTLRGLLRRFADPERLDAAGRGWS